MNLEFFLLSNKNKGEAKKKLSIPANIIESLLTNRQNRNITANNSYQHTESSSNNNNKQPLTQEEKYSMAIKENRQLREENKRLRDIIQSTKDEKHKEKNDNKQSLANLLLSLSYEKQEDNNYFYQNHSNEINLIDDSDSNINIVKSYCNTEGEVYSAYSNNPSNSSKQSQGKDNKAEELNNIFKRTKSLLNKYQSSLKNNDKANQRLDKG